MKNADLETVAVAIYESHVREQLASSVDTMAAVPKSWLMLTAEERDKWRDKAKASVDEIDGRWSREFQGDF